MRLQGREKAQVMSIMYGERAQPLDGPCGHLECEMFDQIASPPAPQQWHAAWMMIRVAISMESARGRTRAHRSFSCCFSGEEVRLELLSLRVLCVACKLFRFRSNGNMDIFVEGWKKSFVLLGPWVAQIPCPNKVLSRIKS